MFFQLFFGFLLGIMTPFYIPELLNKTDIPLNETIIVGDSMLDFTVAKALEIDCALLSNGHNNLERLEATGSKTFSNIQSFSNWMLDSIK